MQSPILLASALPTDAALTSTTSPDGLLNVPLPSIAVDNPSPPESGSTTPTASNSDAPSPARRSRNFLDLAPLTGFLRGRYPPNSGSRLKEGSPTTEAPPDESAGYTEPLGNEGSARSSGVADPQEDESGVAYDDDDERRTIRGCETREDDSRETKPEVLDTIENGHAPHAEKVVNGVHSATGVLVNEIN